MSAVRQAAPALTTVAEPPRHFLDLRDHTPAMLRGIVDLARSYQEFSRIGGRAHPRRPLDGCTLGIVLEKPSTRTRVSFEVAIRQMGGDAVVLSSRDMQLGRGETIADTARVLSRYVDALVLRTSGHDKLRELADYATVPVINGLTSRSHPVQILAEVLAFETHRGPVQGSRWAWIGDGNNVARSLIEGAAQFGYRLALATPEALPPCAETIDWARAQGARIETSHDKLEAARGADCVVTDTWVSMGDEDADRRFDLLSAFQVDERVMQAAGPDALFMHCLPAHRGEEVTDSVIDGPQSVVFDEAEARLHVQKALLAWALGGRDWVKLASL
ncbi:ornithine carbamoyltransferase [Endobacter medicaginis]|uniref:Ornithine carbamoyltransferase n=1 Tax=Endobacter medicaginis TaxID=1181271 RepID=A0A839V3H6_9PROT|nr:ornithine carbamoyltransferase [Endobacter medicaginis]MBB3174041.1 ornithine carbamoyltransferase [Endobacter medicaginis]MCX5477028.1 ornithine carbamoyltransferase [Endobacter medicaginis]NVN30923.1 ornithine carbamoyltransferase [Endobacter medicaginis]